MRRILLLSGPNLDLLGSRQPDVYGVATLPDHVQRARAAVAGRADVEHLQSASEPDLVAAVHAARGRCDAIVINAGALTHYGWSLHDALAAFEGVVVEVHISNPERRELWRRTSVVAPVAEATLSGVGRRSFELGAVVALDLVEERAGR